MFTVAIPIALTNIAFTDHRNRPYLGIRTTVLTAAVALAGIVLLRFAVPLSQDPGYAAPAAFVVGYVAAIIGLGVVALVILPRRRTTKTARTIVDLPWLYAGSFAAALSVLWLTFRAFGSSQPAFTHGTQVLVPMLAAAAIFSISFAALSYYSRSEHWSSRHTLAVIGGASVGHTVAGIGLWSGNVERIALVVIAVVSIALVVYGHRRVAYEPSHSLRTA